MRPICTKHFTLGGRDEEPRRGRPLDCGGGHYSSLPLLLDGHCALILDASSVRVRPSIWCPSGRADDDDGGGGDVDHDEEEEEEDGDLHLRDGTRMRFGPSPTELIRSPVLASTVPHSYRAVCFILEKAGHLRIRLHDAT